MKTSRLFAFTAFSVGMLFVGVQAGAQTSQSVSSTATVTTPITADAIAPLAFGTVTKGQANTVAASSANAGALYFSGDEGDEVTVTVPETAELTTASGAGGTMTVTIDRAAMLSNNLDNVQGNASAFDASSGSAAVNLSADNAGDGTDADGLGQIYLWVGGSVSPDAGQQRGNYSGTFSVNASYSN